MGKEVYLNKAGASFQQLKPESRSHIRGLQAQMWSETIKGRNMLEYYLLPKLIGFSQTAWTRERDWESEPARALRLGKMDAAWNVFANAIATKELPKLSKWNGGYHFRMPQAGVEHKDGLIMANTELPGLKIRYTLDGSVPCKTSPVYSQPLKYHPGIRFKTLSNSYLLKRMAHIPVSGQAGFEWPTILVARFR